MEKLFCGDNFKIMTDLPGESIDLVYADPPFNTKNQQDGTYVPWRKKNSKHGYSDKVSEFEKDTYSKQDYLEQMQEWHQEHREHELYFLHHLCRPSELFYFFKYIPVIYQIKRLLKWGGALYYHIDYRTTHIWRVILSKIFTDKDCFNSEIIWHYPNKVPLPNTSNKFSMNHNTILFWTKYKQKTPDAIHKLNLAYESNTKIKQRTVWTIPSTRNPVYATQKPLALLERIIRASSNEGDTVLDPFCGSGTTIVAAASLKRNAIGIDQNPDAIKITKERLSQVQLQL